MSDLEHDVRVHLQEPPVAVVREALVLRDASQRLHRPVVEPQVQDRVHHPGHRDGAARAHGYEKRVVRASELLARDALEMLDRVGDLLLHAIRHVVRDQVMPADFGRDGEPGRHADAQSRHLGQVGALATEEALHPPVAVGLALGKKVNVFHISRLFAGFLSSLLEREGGAKIRARDFQRRLRSPGPRAERGSPRSSKHRRTARAARPSRACPRATGNPGTRRRGAGGSPQRCGSHQ